MTTPRVVLGIASALLCFAAAPASAQRTNPPVDPLPYAETAFGTLNMPYVNGFIFFPTPKGHRYVIEQASMTCTTASNADVFTLVALSVTKMLSATPILRCLRQFSRLKNADPRPLAGISGQVQPASWRSATRSRRRPTAAPAWRSTSITPIPPSRRPALQRCLGTPRPSDREPSRWRRRGRFHT